MLINNAAATLQTILQDTATIDELEKFDKLLGQAGDSSEKHCKRRRPEYYSILIHQLRIKKSIFKCHLNNLRHERELLSPILQQWLARADIDFTLPTSAESTKHLLTTVSQELQEASQQSFEICQNELKSKINQKNDPTTETNVQRLRSIKKNEATRSPPIR